MQHRRDVVLEVALFDPRRTAATGRKLNLQSDARYRFERGLDPAFATLFNPLGAAKRMGQDQIREHGLHYVDVGVSGGVWGAQAGTLAREDLAFSLSVILLGLLFFVGWRAARLTLAWPWLAGTIFLLVGVLLVAMAIPLGG